MMRAKLSRPGYMGSAWATFLASVGVLAALTGLLYVVAQNGSSPQSTGPLVVYCAAGLTQPVEAIARAYEKTYGVPVQVQYGGSQTLLANMEVSRLGDLYLPADDYYIELARKKDLIRETIPVARMTPVIAVFKGNPKKIQKVDDLLRPDVSFSLADPDATATGKLCRDALRETGQWEPLRKKPILVSKPTVNDVANDIKLRAVDAGFVWDATVRQNPDLEAIPVPGFDARKAHVSVAVLASCNQPAAALRFARYLAARDRGLQEVEKAGFQPVDGDAWAEVAELKLFSGSMLRPAIEQTIALFEQREGVTVTRVYNGCGILVGQMKTGSHPDAYFACDTAFMKQVHDLFLPAVDVSTNQLVIVVRKGNPHQIKTLKDLTKPGLRLGVGHEQQCAMGAITQETLKQVGLQSQIEKNIKVRSPTGDMLINQLRASDLDAVIAYLSNTADSADVLDAISIEGIPCSVVTQPIAVAKASPNKQLGARLMDAIRSRESRERFEAYGFGWQPAK